MILSADLKPERRQDVTNARATRRATVLVRTSCTLYTQQWKTILSNPSGARPGSGDRENSLLPRTAYDHCIGLLMSIFYHVSFAWPLDMIRINPSNPVYPVYLHVGRAMTYTIPTRCIPFLHDLLKMINVRYIITYIFICICTHV